ncbi:hypothetical protein Fmac_022990 [Flemingia macrophylla]|uniref:Uncharacterized protein n=1 Tax=Flemingia macrophylla TaxID=520843 RepID=A0ABD1LK86_9FABA
MVVMCCCLVVVHGKRRLRSLFWRVRADIRRQMKKARSNNNNNFSYDPFSYSLNFDDGHFSFGSFALRKPTTTTLDQD